MDSLRLPEPMLNLLFAALLTTAGGTFIGGNLLLSDTEVLQRSGQIALACLVLLLIFYTLARFLSSVTWGLVITYILILGVTYGRQPWLIVSVYACGACGLLYALRFLRVARRQWGSVLLMGVIGAATALALANFLPPESFDILLRLHAGEVYTDALAHTSAAAMIKNYGVMSSGLHGLVETPYHALFHRLMAGLSLLSGCGTFEVYGVVRMVFFLPILIFGVVACSAMLEWKGHPSVPTAWGLVCIFLVGPRSYFPPGCSGIPISYPGLIWFRWGSSCSGYPCCSSPGW